MCQQHCVEIATVFWSFQVSAAIEVTLNANLHLVYASHNKGMPYDQADFMSYVSYAVNGDIKRQKKKKKKAVVIVWVWTDHETNKIYTNGSFSGSSLAFRAGVAMAIKPVETRTKGHTSYAYFYTSALFTSCVLQPHTLPWSSPD